MLCINVCKVGSNCFSHETNINLTLSGGPIMIAACEHDLKTKESLTAKLFVTIGVIRYNSQAAGTCTNVFILCKV